MILKGERIAEHLRPKDPSVADPLVITPTPNLEALQKSGSASVDLRLGTCFSYLRPARQSHLAVDSGTAEAELTKSHYVGFGDSFYLHPGSFVLGVTVEWIRLPAEMAGYVIGRSSWGRRGLIIATAIQVHPGFTGCITLELSNVGEIPIAVSPGMAVCQLCLHGVEGSKVPTTDQSQFVGMRKPRLGRVAPDDIATALSKARR